MRTGEFDDPAFLTRLRAGDPDAYRALIRRFHASLVSVANSIIGSRAQAEEVVQDAWLAVFNGIGRFEGRSSLATWLFSIVLNRARTRASREARLVGLPGILDGARGSEQAVDVTEFRPDGHWVDTPRLWDELNPERVVSGRQLWAHVQDAIERLPAGQRAVIVLRDMEGREAEEVCTLLGISAENQRVLLHRARGRIRKAIDVLVAGDALVAGAASAPAAGSGRATPRRGATAALERLITRGVVIRGVVIGGMVASGLVVRGLTTRAFLMSWVRVMIGAQATGYAGIWPASVGCQPASVASVGWFSVRRRSMALVDQLP